MARFAPSRPAHFGAAFGAQSNLSTSTSDAISVARQTYDKSDLAKKALYDHTAVKSRDQLAAYVAPKLRILVSYIDNDAAGAKAAEQLRYISTTPAYKIGDFIGNNLSYVLKYGPIKDRTEVKKAISYWSANQGKMMYTFNFKEQEAIKKLAKEYELEDVKRQARAEVESEYAKRSTSDDGRAIKSNLRGKTWNDRQYTYEVSSDGLSVYTNGKTFTPSSSTWSTLKANLEKAILSPGRYLPTRSSGSSPSPSSEVAAKDEPSEETPAAEEGLTQKSWFWPAVILGTTGLGIGAYFIFSNKSAS